jgi:excisionase family DNA binding protein
MKYLFDKRFFTIPEAASMLAISPETVKVWIKTGKIEAVRIGRQRHIPETELINYLKINNL